MTTRYILHINGGPKVGWAQTYTSRGDAQRAANVANRRDGITASVAEAATNLTMSPAGEIAYLIGGPAGLPYQRDPRAPWVETR